MDGVEQLMQMSEVERMREVMDLVSDNMQIQNDKDRMEMLAMLASTTAVETNLMSVKFARSVNTQATETKTKRKKAKALMKGVKQAKNEKGKEVDTKQKTQPNNSSTQNKQQPQTGLWRGVPKCLLGVVLTSRVVLYDIPWGLDRTCTSLP